MKIIENDKPVLCVYENYMKDICICDMAYENEIPHEIQMTPLEAMTLSNVLKSVCDKTDYFKGFRKDD